VRWSGTHLVRAGTSAIPKPESGLADDTVVILGPAIGRTPAPPPGPQTAGRFLMPVEDRPMAFERRQGGPSSPTAGDPCSGACATRAYAVPRAAAGARRQVSTPTRVRASGRDADTNGAALGHPTTSSAGHDTIVDFDAEGGTRIAGTATRSDLHGPTAVETRSRLRRIPRGCCRNRHGGDDRST
jgi:hypothetical protein